MPAEALKPLKNWSRRKEARPGEILEAALLVFAEKGFAAARMEDIAARAGVTKGTIYLYFPSKEAVFKSLLSETIATNLDSLVDAAKNAPGPAPEILRFVMTALGQFICTSERIVLPKIILSEAGNFPEPVRFYRTEIIDKGLAALTALIARGVANGEFRAVKPEFIARQVIGPLLLTGLWRIVFEPFDKQPFDHQGLIQSHIETLLRGLEPERSP
jgi:AcrR family transcriptional regulator